MVPQGASVLFRPVQAVALSSGLKDPLTFNPKPNCNLQNVLTRMCSLLKQIPFFFFPFSKDSTMQCCVTTLVSQVY